MTEMSMENRKKGIGYALISAFCYAASPAMIKLVYKFGISTETLLLDRYFIALIMGLFLFINKSKEEIINIDKRQGIVLFAVGLLSAVLNICNNYAQRVIPGMACTALIMSYVIIVVIFEVIMGREKLNKKKLASILLTCLGFAILMIPQGAGRMSVTGFVVGLAGAALYSIQILSMNTEILRPISPELFYVATSIPIVILMFINTIAHNEPVITNQMNQFICVLVLAIFNIFIPRMAFYRATRMIGATLASEIDLLEPLFSGFFSYMILKETVSKNIFIGTLVIIIAIAISQNANEKTERNE